MDLVSQSGMSPTQGFSTDDTAHFSAHSQYPFPSATGAFTVDQAMDMSDAYPGNPATNLNARISSIASAASMSNGTLPIDSGSMNSGPSHTSHPRQMSPLSDHHRDSEDIQDPALMGGDPKRKRSKVSRACDQCRKKKIRCDADTENGLLKTCSNCQKANQTCEYSRIPQKRGPSKGYIKELSERVQQVEGQLALQNATGFRSSIDGASIGLFGDPSFSPDEDLLLRRQSSLSNHRSPFAGFNRDRMPSMGSWNNTSPRLSRDRDRDRASIAVAPDQSLPSPSHTFVKPFWSEWSEQSPKKRRKISHDNIRHLELSEPLLDKYYRQIHPTLPILPERDDALRLLRETDPIYEHAFIASLKTLPNSGIAGEIIQNTCDPALPTYFKSRDELEAFIITHENDGQESSKDVDKLVLFWTCLIQAIKKESDVERINKGSLSKSAALRIATQIAVEHFKIYKITDGSARYFTHWDRAWHCFTILARLHALALAIPDPVPNHHHSKVAEAADLLPGVTAYLSEGCSFLHQVFLTNSETLIEMNPTRRNGWTENITILKYMDQAAKLLNLGERGDWPLLVQEMRLLLLLLSARAVPPIFPTDVITPTLSLGNLITSDSQDPASLVAYNPLRIHSFTLVAYSLLELRQARHNINSAALLRDTLAKVTAALEQIKERGGLEGWKDNEPKLTRIHWAEVLLHHIKTQVPEEELAGLSEGLISSASSDHSMIKFGELINDGYLWCMLQYVKHMELKQI